MLTFKYDITCLPLPSSISTCPRREYPMFTVATRNVTRPRNAVIKGLTGNRLTVGLTVPWRNGMGVGWFGVILGGDWALRYFII